MELSINMKNHYCKFLPTFLLAAASFISAIAQHPQQTIDSLLSVLTRSGEDTNKVMTLIALGDGYIKLSDFEPAKKYAEEALHLSEKLNYQKGISDALLFSGSIYWNQGDLEAAMDSYKHSLRIKVQIEDKKGLAKVYANIGLVYLNQGNYAEALANNETALAIKKELNDTDVGATLFNIANIKLTQGNYPSALQYLHEALEAFEHTGNKRGIALVYMNMGRVYQVQNMPQEAIQKVLASLAIAKDIGNKKLEVACHNNLAIIYSDSDDFDESLKHYSQAIAIAESIGAKHEISVGHGNMGAIYFMQGAYDKALRHYMEALPMAEEIGDKENMANLYSNIGKTYRQQKRYADAGIYLEKGYALATEIGAKQVIKESLEGLTNLEEQRHDYKQALYYQRLLSVLKDSLLNESNSQLITEMQTKYETEKKEKEIALLTKDKEIQAMEIKKQTLLKKYFIVGLVLILVLFFLLYHNFRIRQKVKLENIRNNIAADLHDDIGSTLNSISLFSEVAKQEAGKVIPALEEIGVSARKIIDAMSDIVWTINPENDTFENVIARMRSAAYLQFKAKGIEFVFKADEALNKIPLPMLARKNMYLLFKEATTNIVKHSNASRATFHLLLEKKNIKLVIWDNGVSFDVNEPRMGNGIKNMKRRAAEIGANLVVESGNGKGTTIELNYKP